MLHRRYINQSIQISRWLPPELMNEVLPFPQKLQLHSLKVVATDFPHKKCLVSSTVYRANLLWQSLPSEVKDCGIILIF